MQAPTYKNPEFDEFADNYDAAIDQGLSVSGEKKEFFATGRVNWLAGRLARLSFKPRSILDFGCGTGAATPFLLRLPGAESLLGVEVSAKSLQVARKLNPDPRAQFKLCEEYQPTGDIDLAFCNGVFHHILPAERDGAISFIHRSLRPQGLFSFWENNPWNPGTRYVMSRIPFDRDAIPLAPPEAKRLLRKAGFEIVAVDFLFIFPRALGFLRPLERLAVALPMGAQYQVLARKV